MVVPAKNQAVRYLILSQIALACAIFVCIAIDPAPIIHNYPLSYYGTTVSTAIPYAVGFIIAIWFIGRAATRLPSTTDFNSKLQSMLQIFAVLMAGILITPYKISTFIGYTHLMVSIALFLFEVGLAVWLVAREGLNVVDISILGVQIAGCVVSAMSIGPHPHFRAIGELVATLAFSILLTRSVSRIEHVAI